MAKIYLIRASRLEARGYLVLALACALLLATHVELDLYGISAVSLLLLFGVQSYRALVREPELQLQLFARRGEVLLRQSGQTHLYVKYKVYPSRWFAILKLVDTTRKRTLFLNPDRFESDAAWRSCRRDLARLEAGNAA